MKIYLGLSNIDQKQHVNLLLPRIVCKGKPFKFQLGIWSGFEWIKKRDRFEDNLSRSHYLMICESEKGKEMLAQGIKLVISSSAIY